MGEQYQCRFCPKSYKEVLEFLDHFETHMKQNEQPSKFNSKMEDQNEEKETPNIRLEDETISKKTQCEICDKSFSTKQYTVTDKIL